MDGGMMRINWKAWLVVVAMVLLATTPLAAQGDVIAPTAPDAVATHGGWICQDWPWHICVP
jgi:hypothetical protein